MATLNAHGPTHEAWKAGLMAALPWPDDVKPETRALVASALDALSIVGVALSIWSVPNERRHLVESAWCSVLASTLSLIAYDIGLRGDEARACAMKLATTWAHVDVTLELEPHESEMLRAILEVLPLE
jgi:hypothetical protein